MGHPAGGPLLRRGPGIMSGIACSQQLSQVPVLLNPHHVSNRLLEAVLSLPAVVIVTDNTCSLDLQ